jgi:NAD(P)-dependent dehydrogenase (short-subunit alcohol dehydrogenase family)
MNDSLHGKTILVTGAAGRFSQAFALTCAHAGADVIIHHAPSEEDEESLCAEIVGLGCKAISQARSSTWMVVAI